MRALIPAGFPTPSLRPSRALFPLPTLILQGLSQLSGARSIVVSSPTGGGYSGTSGIIGTSVLKCNLSGAQTKSPP